MINNRRTAASLVGAALVVTLVVVPSFWAFRQSGEAAGARKHTYEAMHRADALLSALRYAESGQRGYLLTGDEAFLESYLATYDFYLYSAGR
jgi:CHASE3 domain sensor protein